MHRTSLLTLLVAIGCTEYDVNPKTENPEVPDADTAVDCPPQIPDCRDTEEDTGEPPDTEVPNPDDCEVIIATARTVNVLPECEGEGALVEVTDPWNVSIEWQWTGLSSNPSVQDVITTPVIGNLTDDNGDGRVDENDIPDVMTVASVESNFTNGTLVVLDGATGTEHWSLSGYDASGGGALADLDSDGVSDIIVFNSQRRVVALDASGNVMWTSSATVGTYPQATVADLDADGDPEVIADTVILNGQTGATIATLSITGSIPYRMPAVGDLDQDGDQEVIVGNTVYDHNGNRLWSSTISGSYGHWSAILDYDGDPEAEVAMIGGGQMGIYEDDGTELVRVSAGTGQPGAPCVADFDGDNEAEIGWASSGVFVMFELDGTQLWSQTINDSSGLASCSGYDVNGDLSYEVLYADQDTFYIFDGATGAVNFSQTGHASGTLWEYPSVADVDNDNSAEIVIGSNNYWQQGWGGITVFGHNGDGWPKSGTTWHVHDFAVSNINPDGSVPANPTPSWQEYNVYRARPAVDDPSYPDLGVLVRDLCVADCEDGPVKISVQVENKGGEPIAAGTPWAFYKNDNTSTTLVTTGTLPEVASGEAPEGFVIEVLPSDIGSYGFILVVDDDGSGGYSINECDETNNRVVWADRICG
ncbi:MAG: hypothetical protein H6739_02170 [Alphaproteobacteria bacterium]|nr:hypothetical protein [Alphaproteobacteria bacterium]